MATWKEEIDAAKRYQETGGRLTAWKRYRGWYRNKYPSQVVSVNLIFAIGRALVPQLYFKNPTVVVHARKPNFEAQAKVLESIDSWLIDHIGLKQQLKMMIVDAFLTNIGVAKIGYHSISTELPPPMDDTMTEMSELLGAPEKELSEELHQKSWSYHDYVRADTPWFLRMRPQDILVPDGFIDEHEAPWVAYRIIRPVKDVIKDPVYTSKGGLSANVGLDTSETGVVSPNLRGSYRGNKDFVELFEIWDKRDGTVRVLSLDHDKWLRNEEHGLNINGVPSVVLRFNPDGEDFWGVPDVEQIHKQVIELNENRTHEMVSKRLANIKGIVNKEIIDQDEITKLEKGVPGVFVLANGSPRDAIASWASSVPPDLWRTDDVIRQDIREVVGFSRNQAGEYAEGRKTATETEAVREAFQLRADERRDLVGDLVAETFRDKIHPMLFQYWTEQRVIRVTALGGWVKYTGEGIRGDYDVACVADSTLPTTKRMKQEMAAKAFEVFRGDPRIKQRELYAKFIQAFPEFVADPEELLVPEEEYMMAQQQAMMQALQQGGPQGKPNANVRRQVPSGR